MNPILLSQRDPRWINIPLGFSVGTIGVYGCTITAIGMKFGVTPEFVNEQLKSVDGYAASPADPFSKNLVIWKKLEEALPGVKFNYRYGAYDNEIVKANIPCLVEVNGAPIGGDRHWVLFVGDQKLYDPWDGQEKPTSTYVPLSFVVLEGQYDNATENVKCLVPDTPEWRKKYEELVYKATEFDKSVVNSDAFKQERDEALGKLSQMQGEFNSINGKYAAFVALGYNTVDDIDRKCKEKDDTILALQKEIAGVRQRNGTLAGELQKMEEEDHTAFELGQKASQENKELKNALVEVGRAAGVERVTTRNIVTSIFGLKDLADRFIKSREEEEKKKQAPPPAPQGTSDNLKPASIKDVNWLLQLFQLIPSKREVK